MDGVLHGLVVWMASCPDFWLAYPRTLPALVRLLPLLSNPTAPPHHSKEVLFILSFTERAPR